jgi:hypothetical protein
MQGGGGRVRAGSCGPAVHAHAPLREQFDTHEGIRQIELDVFADPAGEAGTRPR